MKFKFNPKVFSTGFLGMVALIFAFITFYQVPEGHVGIVKRFGKAVEQTEPGLHFKLPFVDHVESIEVRERKSVEELSAATDNQLPITATVSVNWTVHKTSAMDIFIKYGGLDQFGSRILDPKLRQAAKASLSKFRADQLIREREKARSLIQDGMLKAMSEFPISIEGIQIEDIQLPRQYMDAVLAKEKAREDAEREKNVLEQQRLQALQAVNTADAEKQSAQLRADGVAYATEAQAKADAAAIILRGEAEAAKITAVNKALANNPLLVDYEKAKNWDGQLPRVNAGSSALLLDIGAQ